MINFDDVTKKNNNRTYPNWTQIPDHPYRILLIRSSGSRKTNSLFNLISHQTYIDKIYLHAKYLYEAKYQFLVNIDSKAFIEYSNDIDIYKYNLNKKSKTVFLMI